MAQPAKGKSGYCGVQIQGRLISGRDNFVDKHRSRPLPGCDLDFDGCEFYFCEAYVPVDTPTDQQIAFEEIIGKARNELLDMKFELVDISTIVRFDPSQWEVIGDSGSAPHELAQSAETSQSIVLSAFRSEDIEEERQYKHTIFNID